MNQQASRIQVINAAIQELRLHRFSDTRTTVFDVKAELNHPITTAGKPIRLVGQALTPEQHQQILACLHPEYLREIEDQVDVLIQGTMASGVIRRTVTDMRSDPSNQSQRISQALIGESLKLISINGDWTWVQMDHDNYLGWVHSSCILPLSLTEIQQYKASLNARVFVGWLPTFPSNENGQLHHQSGLLPFGSRVAVTSIKDDLATVLLPDGRLWQMPVSGMLTQDRLPQPDVEGVSFVLDCLKGFIGVPYLWGGRTPFGFDCSGLAQAFLSFLGIEIPRDADQQFRAGQPIKGTLRLGDLLFFGEQSSHRPSNGGQSYENITHVAISLGDDEFIHANGAAWGVSINSLNPDSPGFRSWLRDHLVEARRFI